MNETISTRSIPVRSAPLPEPPSIALSETPDPETTNRLLEFASSQIEKMSSAASVGNVDGQPGFFELNRALADWQTVNLGLITIYAVAKTEYARTVEEFEDWYSEKYILVRDEMNPRSLTPTKWYGAKEIEMQVRVRFRDEFHRFERAKVEADQKISLIRRLLDSWSSHHFVLSRLSKNVEAEVMGLGSSGNNSDGF